MERLETDEIRAYVANFAEGCPRGSVNIFFKHEGYEQRTIQKAILDGLRRGILSYGEERRLIALEKDD